MLSFCLLLLAMPDDGKSPEKVVAGLKAGLMKEGKDLAFRSTFRTRDGFAKTVEAGLRDGIDPSIAEPREVIGVFHRKGALMRFSLDYGRAPIPTRFPAGLPAQPGVQSVRDVSYDEVTDGKIQVRYHPGASGDNVSVELRQKDLIGAGQLSNSEMTPLRPYRNWRFDPFKLWDLGKGPPAAKTEVAVLGDNQTEVTLTSDGDYKQWRRIRFRTAPAPIIMIQMDQIVTHPDGTGQEIRIRLSDFQDCPGGPVARRVVSVFKQKDADRVSVREWISTDLGVKLPTDADFIVSIAPTTTIGGLRNAPQRGIAGRQIDITLIDESDLDNGIQ